MHNLRFERPRSVPCPLNNETKKKNFFILILVLLIFLKNYNLKSIF